ISNLLNNETVYIKNESEEIITDLIDTYRYQNHNGVFLKLRRGTNNLQVEGACNITLRYQYRVWG
ncbi:MAG: hypothetical protein MJB12_04065, partial [Firmicutes bacterium]|nr:hypothetical protein [Bacillota bacterium]